MNLEGVWRLHTLKGDSGSLFCPEAIVRRIHLYPLLSDAVLQPFLIVGDLFICLHVYAQSIKTVP